MTDIVHVENLVKRYDDLIALDHFNLSIAPGEIFTERNLTVKRPGTGLSPMLWDTLIGTHSTRAYHPDDQIQ